MNTQCVSNNQNFDPDNMISVLNGNESLLNGRRENIARVVSRWMSEAKDRGEPLLRQKWQKINNQLLFGRCVLLLDIDNDPIGFATTYPCGHDGPIRCWEVGSVYVPPNLRGMGFGHRIYRAMAKMHPNDCLVQTTKNPLVVSISNKLGFVEISPLALPHVVRFPLCFDAPCYQECWPGCCRSEIGVGGNCVIQRRLPLSDEIV